MWNRLKTSKTFWAALAGLAGSVIGESSEAITPDQLQSFQAIMLMLIGVFVRDGLEKKKQ